MKNYVFVKLMELAEKYRITVAPFVPPIVVEIAKSEAVDSYDLSSMRMVMPGAAPMGRNCRKHLRLSFLTLNLDMYVDSVHDNDYVVSFRLGTKAIGEDIEGQQQPAAKRRTMVEMRKEETE
ncbi:4-coumarate--CoA ligase-like [Dendrobium catenatum]|uniref:4-coumarate--CoA ligase-like n=1 Tax=Dendrobium catenatum TaxID=906689 RepID=UPI00109F6F09|nr:4-coumarate--CoA ligase-like [Dendrobium catenatum]